MMKKTILFLLVLMGISISAQKKINNFKYIIVPKQFDSFNKVDKYQVNSLVKFLFNKNNFTVFFNDEKFPEDLAKNKCLSLTANLENVSGMFTTKTQISLKDCYNNVLFTSKKGTSKIKEYKRAYHEAIRRSFESIKALKYKYEALPENEEKAIASVNRVEKVEDHKITSKKEETPKEFEALYAQSTDLGFQLVDKEPKVVFKILKTQYPGLFIIKDKNGMLVKKENNFWEAQYYVNGKLLIKSYKVKF